MATSRPHAKPPLDARTASAVFAGLRQQHPEARCELDHIDPFTLLIATVLSAQTTDVLVNKATPPLFAAFPTPKALAAAEPDEVQAILQGVGLGMYRQKTKSIIGLSQKLIAEHSGKVPNSLAALIALPGVGRKTANLVLGVCFGTPEGVVTDTHVQRLSQRLGLTIRTTPEEIERDLAKLFPRQQWDKLSHTLIFHGRRVCFAKSPACSGCQVNKLCPSAFHADLVGRKTRPKRGSVAVSAKRVSPKPAAKQAATKKPAKKKPTKKKPTKKKPTKKKPATKKPATKKPATNRVSKPSR